MPKFKVVLERTAAVTYQAVAFADAADPRAANEAARALDEAGKLAWDAATSSCGDTAHVETMVATADEVRAAAAQGFLNAPGTIPDQVSPASLDNDPFAALEDAPHKLEASGPFADGTAAEAWVDGDSEIGGGKQPRLAQLEAERSLRRAQRIIELLGIYGRAKFGNEWWPGNARPWLGAKKCAELEELLG